MKVICYGDSNTWGFDPRAPLGGRYDTVWVDILAQKLNWNVINQGENGREIPQSPVFFPSDTGLLIIMLGTNDLLQFWSSEAVCEKMERFLSAVNLEQHRILLIAPPPMKLGAWVEHQAIIDSSIQLAEQYKTLAERLSIRFIDSGLWNIPLSFDGVHFTEEGHKTFAEDLCNYLNKGDLLCWKPV